MQALGLEGVCLGLSFYCYHLENPANPMRANRYNPRKEVGAILQVHSLELRCFGRGGWIPGGF